MSDRNIPDETVNRGSPAYVLESWLQALRVLQAQDSHERDEHFEMGDWAIKTECGTVACIAGHCILDHWFQKNRPVRPAWTGRNKRMLAIWGCDFDTTFGPDWWQIFYSDFKTHADAVRAVMRRIQRMGGPRISPFGFGMPVFRSACDG